MFSLAHSLRLDLERHASLKHVIIIREAFLSKKQRNLGISPNRGGGVKKSKKSQVSVGKSSKLWGGSSEIKKIPSFRGYQRLIK